MLNNGRGRADKPSTVEETTIEPEIGGGQSIATFIRRVETIGFMLIIALGWLVEVARLPHYLFGETFNPSWKRAILRTLVIGVVWAWVYWMTKPLLKRLHDLEEFVHSRSSRPDPAKFSDTKLEIAASRN